MTQQQVLPGSHTSQQLEQLMLQLMPQELVWTPHRLSEFLASGAPHTPASAALQHPPSVMQLLPLVSSVVASKAQARQQGAGSNSSSDTCCGKPNTAAGRQPFEQDTSQPSSSSGQLTVCWLGSTQQRQPGAADNEMTSPRAHAQPRQGQQATLMAGHSSNKQSHITQQQQQQQQQWWMTQQGMPPQPVPGVVWQAACQQQVSQGQAGQLWQQQQQGPHPQPMHLESTATPWVQGQLPHAAAAATAQAAAGTTASGFPHKQALPGDYPVVEQNPAWSAAALTNAAAAAANSLGLPPAASLAGGSNVHGDDTSSMQVSDAARSQEQARAAYAAPVFGVLMLVHEKGSTCSEAWDAWEGGHSGKAVVRVHLKEGVSTAGLPGDAWISSRQLPSRICSKWGCISLTAAILQAAADMLQQDPQLQHIALVSGQDVPVSAVPRDLRPGLSLFGRFQFGRVFDDAARQVACEVLQQQLGMTRAESRAWGDALVFHHTWTVLDRQLLLALISKQEELLRVGSVLNERFMQPDVAVAADEFILMTAAIRYGFVKQVVQRKLHAHMSAVRRQQRAQQQQQQQQQQVMATAAAAAGAAGQPHGLAGEGAAAAAAPQVEGDGAKPAKQPRLSPKPGHDAPAGAGAGDSGRQRVEGSGSRPGSRDSSKVSNAAKPEPRSLPAEASRHSSGDSSSEPAPSGRRPQRRERASGDAAIPPEQLVGRRIKVWWQMDQAFYCGVVTYYSLSTRRHTVKYDDGDVEIINLAKEAWKLEGPLPPGAAPPPPAAAAAAGLPAGRAGGGSAGRTGGGGTAGPSAPAPAGPSVVDCALQEGTFGVLLDCCPTLALFHPTQTRHPHEWRNFTECLACDVVSSRSGGANRLTLLDALRLVAPNSALFFRKVAEAQRQVPAQLLGCLKLLWKNRPLPALIEELPLQE